MKDTVVLFSFVASNIKGYYQSSIDFEWKKNFWTAYMNIVEENAHILFSFPPNKWFNTENVICAVGWQSDGAVFELDRLLGGNREIENKGVFFANFRALRTYFTQIVVPVSKHITVKKSIYCFSIKRRKSNAFILIEWITLIFFISFFWKK